MITWIFLKHGIHKLMHKQTHAFVINEDLHDKLIQLRNTFSRAATSVATLNSVKAKTHFSTLKRNI